jgi:hypothetical protein
LVLVLIGATSLIQAGPAAAGDGYDSFGCYEFYDAGSYEAGSNGMLDDDPGLVATTGTFFHGNGGSCTSGVAGYDCRSATDLYELDGTWVKYAGGWRTCVGDGDDGTAVHLINGHDDADGNRSLHVSRIYISGVAHDSYPIVLEVGT